jgi:hypothetical protein
MLVYSRQGPTFHQCIDGVQFINGVADVPDFVGKNLMWYGGFGNHPHYTAADKIVWQSTPDGRWDAVLIPTEVVPSLPQMPSGIWEHLPETLPDDYIRLMDHYFPGRGRPRKSV